MKKLLVLTLALLASGNIFGAAGKNSALIINKTNDNFTFQADYDGLEYPEFPMLFETSAFYQWPRRLKSASKWYKILANHYLGIDLTHNKFGKVINNDEELGYNKVDTSKPFVLFQLTDREWTTENRKTARFVSPQENGKKYYLMENKWDNDTDYVIISEEDLGKT